MRKKTDGGHAIPEEDLREMEQEEGREMPEGVESQTGYCRFCGQGGVVHTMMGWGRDEVNEAVTCRCQCEEAKKYAESKERVQKVRNGCRKQRTVLKNYSAARRKSPLTRAL